jgi:hypothetical protein
MGMFWKKLHVKGQHEGVQRNILFINKLFTCIIQF